MTLAQSEDGDRPVPGIRWVVCSSCGEVSGGRVDHIRNTKTGDRRPGITCTSCGTFAWWDAEPRGSRVPPEKSRNGARRSK